MAVSPDNGALIPSYGNWKKRLGYVAAGLKEKEWPVEQRATTDGATAADCGFYRNPIKEPALNKKGQRNGQWKLIGYKPVALWVVAGRLQCVMDGVLLAERECQANFLSFVYHPVSEGWWRDVAEKGKPWPDAERWLGTTVPAADRDVELTDNAPPTVAADVEHATAIDNAIAVALKTVTSEAEAAQAAGSKNRIAELRLAADKAGKAIYEPMYRVYTAEQKKWSPMVARAVAAEKSLTTAILTFREKERVKVAAAAAEAARLQQAQDEANERAAQRAIARGEPEAPPVVEAAPEPIPALTPVLPTYGTRKVKEEVKKFAVIEDWAKVFAHFQSDQELRDRLEKLATEAIRAGAEVPGATFREGLL